MRPLLPARGKPTYGTLEGESFIAPVYSRPFEVKAVVSSTGLLLSTNVSWLNVPIDYSCDVRTSAASEALRPNVCLSAAVTWVNLNGAFRPVNVD